MEIFYSTDIQSGFIVLGDDESRHCTKVLRKQVGDTIQVIDGKGHLFKGVIESIPKNKPTKILITKKTFYDAAQSKSGFHLAIAPTKNADRMEWLLEKTVELGIDSITFLMCDNSERTNLKYDRLERIAISALKQSAQYWMPQIIGPVKFKSFLEQTFASSNTFIAHCYNTDKQSFVLPKSTADALVLIGPEGDFSQSEVELAIARGFKPITLGNSRLRTETAALHACSIFRNSK